GAQVEAAAWTPDGQRVLTGHKDGTASLWEPARGSELARLAFWGKGADWLALAPNGAFDGSQDGQMRRPSTARTPQANLLASPLGTKKAETTVAAPAPGELPPDLARIPGTAALLASVRVADLWDGELGRPIRRALDSQDEAWLSDNVRGLLGMPAEQVE